ncbi:hypothetical protein LJC31_07590 [Synergistaceae bacterium OttesenSCG-928-I11]|nr:hypothetical protein [Synergistaceae bacterium OttesenSCG-928-I11]
MKKVEFREAINAEGCQSLSILVNRGKDSWLEIRNYKTFQIYYVESIITSLEYPHNRMSLNGFLTFIHNILTEVTSCQFKGIYPNMEYCLPDLCKSPRENLFDILWRYLEIGVIAYMAKEREGNFLYKFIRPPSPDIIHCINIPYLYTRNHDALFAWQKLVFLANLRLEDIREGCNIPKQRELASKQIEQIIEEAGGKDNILYSDHI